MSFCFGARGGSRTRTPLRALAPEASESTNSTTRAEVKRAVPRREVYITILSRLCQPLFSFFALDRCVSFEVVSRNFYENLNPAFKEPYVPPVMLSI